MKKIYVIHENDSWLIPLRKAFKKLHLPFEEWFVNNKSLDLTSLPPEGVFYNRMSASSHTRDHRFSPEFTGSLLAWLQRHNRIVVNGRRALQLELRKSEQYLALQKFAIPFPRTIIVNEEKLLLSAVEKLNTKSFMVKPNRGGKGADVQLFHSQESLEETIKDNQLGESIDGIWLVQEYIQPKNGRVTRVEFVGGEFLYAVSIDSSKGFKLCPSDMCQMEEEFCPANQSDQGSKFTILENYQNPDLDKYRRFLSQNDIGIGAIEYAENELGTRYVYDINTNTNYNNAAELEGTGDKFGMEAIAKYLGDLLRAENLKSNCLTNSKKVNLEVLS